MTFLLRTLLVIALSLFAAPRVMAADGIATVLCAADGTRRVVIFDFDTGVPVEQSVVFETCDHCLSPPMALAPPPVLAPLRVGLWTYDVPLYVAQRQGCTGLSASARGPPVWMI